MDYMLYSSTLKFQTWNLQISALSAVSIVCPYFLPTWTGIRAAAAGQTDDDCHQRSGGVWQAEAASGNTYVNERSWNVDTTRRCQSKFDTFLHYFSSAERHTSDSRPMTSLPRKKTMPRLSCRLLRLFFNRLHFSLCDAFRDMCGEKKLYWTCISIGVATCEQ